VNFIMSSPPAQTQSPPIENFLATVLGWNNVFFFLQWTAPIAHSFCESCTWDHLYILVKTPLYFDWKAQAASMQGFTLWQHATIEIPRCTYSISASFRHTYMRVFFITLIPFVANRTFNTTLTEWLQHLQQSWTRLFQMTESERDK